MDAVIDELDRPAAVSTLEQVLATGHVRTVFQPVVDLSSGAAVGYEALTRGPEGALQAPDRLFAEARRAGRLAELDALCRRTAMRSAVAAGIVDPLTLFLNIEPEVVDVGQLAEMLEHARGGRGDLGVVLEVTERSLSARPAELLASVEMLRAAGWKVALDDVGADDMSLAFMSLLRPEVVKLDLRLVQQRASSEIARVMNAVNAYAERSGAVVLAEGIETEAHLQVALALGATLGQGWLLGRPAEAVCDRPPGSRIELPSTPPGRGADVSPFACLPAGTALRTSTKPLLIEVSKHIEREATLQGSSCILLAGFQHAAHFAPATARRYRALAGSIAFVAAIGEGVALEPTTGVRGAYLQPTDPMCTEWDVVVLGPHFAVALLARDLGDDLPDMDRRFEFALTYDREVVMSAAHSLMCRVAAQPSQPW